MICDFGLAKVMDDAPSGLTTSGSLGTTRYVSPELFMDEGHSHSFSSDIWAWGCLSLQVSLIEADEPPPPPRAKCIASRLWL